LRAARERQQVRGPARPDRPKTESHAASLGPQLSSEVRLLSHSPRGDDDTSQKRAVAGRARGVEPGEAVIRMPGVSPESGLSVLCLEDEPTTANQALRAPAFKRVRELALSHLVRREQCNKRIGSIQSLYYPLRAASIGSR
jgi:hypothetical protein